MLAGLPVMSSAPLPTPPWNVRVTATPGTRCMASPRLASGNAGMSPLRREQRQAHLPARRPSCRAPPLAAACYAQKTWNLIMVALPYWDG
jgi:hypothetical protein